MQGFGFEVDAVEPDPSYSSFGAELYDIPIHGCLYEDASFPAGVFSLISSFHVLEHTPSPRAILEKAYTELQTGGYIFLEVPTINQPYKGDLEEFFWSTHLFTFSKNTLAGLLRDIGFEPLASGMRETAFLWMLARKPEESPGPPIFPLDEPEMVYNQTLRRYHNHVGQQPLLPSPLRYLRGLTTNVLRRIYADSTDASARVGKEIEKKGQALQRRETTVFKAAGASLESLF
jgi:SAM-dependent methyltransferase